MSISHRIIREEAEAEEERLPGNLPENNHDGDGDEKIIERRRTMLSGGSSSSVEEEELEIPDENDDVIVGTRTSPLQLPSGFDSGTSSSRGSSCSKITDDGLPSIAIATTRNENNCTSASSTTNKRHTFLLLVALTVTVMMTTMMIMTVLLSSSSSSSLSVPLPIKNYLSLKKQQTILLPKNNLNSVKDQNKKNGQYQHQFRKMHRFLQEENDNEVMPTITIVVPPGVNSSNTSALNEITASTFVNGSDITVNDTVYTVNSTIENGNGTTELIPNTTATVDPEPPIELSDITNATLLPNSTLLPTIVVPPTLSPTTFSQPNITLINNTLTPTIVLDPTDPVTSSPSMSPTISFQPTISSEPTDTPSISLQPTNIPSDPPTVRPTFTSAPSISYAPSSTPSNLPTNKPTNIPSDVPTESPTISSVPSSVPTASHEPSVSLQPSIESAVLMPTHIFEFDIVMILTNVPSHLTSENVPSNLTSEEIEIWQDVTSRHLFQYYEEIEKTFSDWPIHIIDVQTTLQNQTVEITSTEELMRVVDSTIDNDNDSIGLLPPVAPPLIEAATAMKETMTLNITYSQNVTYSTYESNFTERELYDWLFVIPYQTDPFTYTIDLVYAMNWSTFVLVYYVTPGQQESPAPTPAPIEKEDGTNWATTIAISGSIILAACLIVAFLLWERVHKSDPNGMMFANHRGDASTTSSIGGIPRHHRRFESTAGIQGDLAAMSERDIGGLPMEMYSINRHNNNFNKNSILTGGGESNNSNNSDGEEMINTSIRSAPIMSTIRRSEEQQRLGRRGVLTPNSNTSTHSSFISRTNHTHTSGITNSSSSSSKTMGERSVDNDGYDPSRSSPGIPKQIPISNRNDSNHSSSGGRLSSGSYNSVINRNNSNNRLHPLPPLPPPPRPFEQFDYGDGTNTIPAAHFLRPSVRRSPFGMRVSSITDSTITDFSYLSDAFRMDREYSDPLNDAPELPTISDHGYVFYY
jgi:hypothetical protein